MIGFGPLSECLFAENALGFLLGFGPLSECLFVENAFGFLIGFGPLSERLVGENTLSLNVSESLVFLERVEFLIGFGPDWLRALVSVGLSRTLLIF